MVYIDGDVLDEEDMQRSKADKCKAFFVLSNQTGKDDTRADSNTLKR